MRRNLIISGRKLQNCWKKKQKTKTKHQHGTSYLVISADGPQLHDELEAEEVVGPDGLELQETAEGHQLGPGQVVQGQLILKQFGEFNDLLIAGAFPRVPDLRHKDVTTCESIFD